MSVEKKTINIFWGGKKPFDLLEMLPKKKWQLLGATPCNWASPLSHAPPFCWSRLETPKNLCSKSKRRPSGSLMQFGLSPVNLGPSFTSNWTRTRAYCRTFAPHCRWQRSIFSARLVCVCLNSGGNFNPIIESKFVQSVWYLHSLFYFN